MTKREEGKEEGGGGEGGEGGMNRILPAGKLLTVNGDPAET